MPTNLTPEQIARLRAQGGGVIDGVYYQPQYDSRGSGQDFDQGQQTAWLQYDPNNTEVGQEYQMYDPSGNFQQTGKFQKVNDAQMLAMMALATGGMMALPGGLLSGTFAGAGGAGAGLGAGEATALNLGLSGNVPAELASLTSVTGPAAAAAGGAAAGAAGGAGSAAAGGAGGAMNSFGVLDPALSWGTVPAGMTNFAPAATSLLGKYAGPLATAAGALAGSQKQKQEQNSSRSIPDWLMPYYTGDKGLLSMVQNQLQRSQSPQSQAVWDQISQRGLGLLNQPVAGNGFSKFFPGR